MKNKPNNPDRPKLHTLAKRMATVIGKAKATICKDEGHQYEEQFTGSQLIHKICTRCGAEKFE